MKIKFFLAFLLIAITATQLTALDSAQAGKRCGLGSKLFGSSKSISSQASETLTNFAASGSASISFGTSGCKHNGFLLFDPVVQDERAQEQFEYANANYEELMIEMAAGSGQVLSSFAETFGCSERGAKEFGEMTRKNYPKIFNRSESTPEDMLLKVRETLRSNKTVLELCQTV